MDTEQLKDYLLSYLRQQLGAERFEQLTAPLLEAMAAMGKVLRELINDVQTAADAAAEAMEELKELAMEYTDTERPERRTVKSIRPNASTAWPIEQRQYVPP